jgi:hypothetical protein
MTPLIPPPVGGWRNDAETGPYGSLLNLPTEKIAIETTKCNAVASNDLEACYCWYCDRRLVSP